MKTKIVIEYDGKVSTQVSEGVGAEDPDYSLSNFLQCVLSDALTPFINERHKVDEASVVVCGSKISVTQIDTETEE